MQRIDLEQAQAIGAATGPRQSHSVLVPARGGWRPVLIGDKMILGAQAVPGCVDAPGVADRHCALRSTPEGVYVIDVGSTTGTWLGDKSCHPRPQLARAGNVVRLGRAPVVLCDQRQTGDGQWLGIGDFGSWSALMWSTLADLALVAAAPFPALLLGESGTGKELAAQALHGASARAAKPFVAVNCGALHGDLLLAELFGAERGAYTGCHERRRGAFERADGGTLLLDEVGELSAAAQAALLRVLEVGEIQVLGGASRSVDVRLVCATHRDLRAMVRAGTFRLDLWHRIAIAPVALLPLRLRRPDIAPLAASFFDTAAPGQVLSPEVLAVLGEHDWPGNVRELKNLVLRLAATARTGVPTAAEAWQAVQGHDSPSLFATHGQQARLAAIEALLADGLSAQQAWRQSGLPRCTFYRYLKMLRTADPATVTAVA